MTNTGTLLSAANPVKNRPTTSPNQLNIVSWNCRGFSNSVPYLTHLLNIGCGGVVLQEHWLWPFELSKLQSVSDKIDYHTVSDPRLDVDS